MGAADKVIELMHRDPKLPPAGSLAPATLEGSIELRDVSCVWLVCVCVCVLRAAFKVPSRWQPGARHA